jgi:hypothetical protein
LQDWIIAKIGGIQSRIAHWRIDDFTASLIFPYYRIAISADDERSFPEGGHDLCIR